MSRRHVFRDLRAYICTFSDCTNPDKQYSTQQDWFNHERQVHRRQWYCGQHEAYYDSPELLVDHLNQSHSEEIPQEHVQSFVALSERSADRHTNTPCPLCPEVRPLMDLEGHLAEHLESIALFVLGAEFDADKIEESGRSSGSELSSQLWSHPSAFSRGSQDPSSKFEGRLSHVEDDQTLPIDKHRASVHIRPSLTITPVKLIEQTSTGFTSQVFPNDPLTVSPDTYTTRSQ